MKNWSDNRALSIALNNNIVFRISCLSIGFCCLLNHGSLPVRL